MAKTMDEESMKEMALALESMADSLRTACHKAEENPAMSWFLIGGISVALKRLSLDLGAECNESE